MMQQNKQYNILIISNETTLINKISILFETPKYNFKLIHDPLSAIQLIKEKKFDLIIINFTFSQEILQLLINKIRLFDSFAYIMLVFNNDIIKNTFDIVKNFDIQSYYNKDEDFKQFVINVELIFNSIYEFNRINLGLNNYSTGNKSRYLSTIQVLRKLVEYKDIYTIRHSFRVSKYAILIGKYMKLSRSDLKTLKVGSMFHDIGKISTPNNILLKNSTLTSDEYLQIKAHPLIGSHILYPTKIYNNSIPIVKFHHERYDGKGYPSNLKGDDIPFLTRIVTVADTFDAMTSKRTYRDALPFDKVISEFQKNKGTQFDPEITDVFLDILTNHYSEIKKIQEKVGNGDVPLSLQNGNRGTTGKWGRSFYPCKMGIGDTPSLYY